VLLLWRQAEPCFWCSVLKLVNSLRRDHVVDLMLMISLRRDHVVDLKRVRYLDICSLHHAWTEFPASCPKGAKRSMPSAPQRFRTELSWQDRRAMPFRIHLGLISRGHDDYVDIMLILMLGGCVLTDHLVQGHKDEPVGQSKFLMKATSGCMLQCQV